MLTRTEVATLLGVKPHSLATMLADGRMVRPDEGAGKGAMWRPETILSWQASRPGRGSKPTDPLARFMAKVKEDEETGCWLWQAHIAETGYGTFRTSQTLRGPAHRRGYELLVGPVPDDLELDHLCRVRHCVNPAHLEPVTPHENRSRAPGHIQTANPAKTHCPKGHPYSEENTRMSGNSRSCRECGRIKWRAWYRKRQAVRGLAVSERRAPVA